MHSETPDLTAVLKNQHPSHGLMIETSIPSKSPTLRVTRIRSWTIAVAAISPSISPRGRNEAMRPHSERPFYVAADFRWNDYPECRATLAFVEWFRLEKDTTTCCGWTIARRLNIWSCMPVVSNLRA
jgi:hypothetical protein